MPRQEMITDTPLSKAKKEPEDILMSNLEEQMVSGVLLKRMPIRELLNLRATSTRYYVMAINELFRRHDVEAKKAQLLLLDNWHSRSYPFPAIVSEDDIRNQYHSGDFALQAKLVLYALNSYPQLGSYLAKDFITNSAGNLPLLNPRNRQANFQAMQQIIDGLYTKQFSLEKKVLDQLKSYLAYCAFDLDVSQNTSIMRYLCFCYGVKEVGFSVIFKKLWSESLLCFDERQKAIKFEDYQMSSEIISIADLFAPVLDEEMVLWLKDKIDYFLRFQVGKSYSGVNEIVNAFDIIVKNAPTVILKKLFRSKDDFYLDFEELAWNGRQYLKVILDLLKKLDLDKEIREEVMLEIVKKSSRKEMVEYLGDCLLGSYHFLRLREENQQVDELIIEIEKSVKEAERFRMARSELSQDPRGRKIESFAFYRLLKKANYLAKNTTSLSPKLIESVVKELFD